MLWIDKASPTTTATAGRIAPEGTLRERRGDRDHHREGDGTITNAVVWGTIVPSRTAMAKNTIVAPIKMSVRRRSSFGIVRNCVPSSDADDNHDDGQVAERMPEEVAEGGTERT